MRLFKLSNCLMAVAISSLFIIQASAQVFPENITFCLTSGGDIKNGAPGLEPVKPCTGQSIPVTISLKAGVDNERAARIDDVDALQADIDQNEADGDAAIAAEAAARASADSTEAGLRASADSAEAAARASADNTEATTRGTADTAEANARIAADNTLQANIDAEALARAAADTGLHITNTNNIDANAAAIATNASDGGTAHTNLQANIDAEALARAAADNTEATTRGNADTAEANARIAADNTLQANINAEALARAAADTGLQRTNTNNIDANAAAIADHEGRISANETDIAGISSEELAQGVLYTDSGSIGHDNENYYRTLTYNPVSGDLIFSAEFNHSLDPIEVDSTTADEDPTDGYWYCTVGDQIMNGEIAKLVLNQADDVALVDGLVGFHDSPDAIHSTLCEDGCWAYKFEDLYGNGTSPYIKIQVFRDSTSSYVPMTFHDSFPLRGWFFGNRNIDSHGGPDQVYIALSNPDLVALLKFRGWSTADMPDGSDHVVVDLDKQVLNLLTDPDGSSR